MFVRKFEAESLEEALGNIKKELGPDAIILKTVTNKGLKGAFKKRKIEITAAISERNYVKKTKVDKVFSADQKEEFYSSKASYVANMIDQYNDKKGTLINDSFEDEEEMLSANPAKGYGTMALNKQVKQAKNSERFLKSGLDSFLSSGSKTREEERIWNDSLGEDRAINEDEIIKTYQVNKVTTQPAQRMDQTVSSEESDHANFYKLSEIEAKLFELTKTVQKLERKEPVGVYQLRTLLTSLDISAKYVNQLTKKCLFELKEDELQNTEFVFEFALKEMMSEIKTTNPLFSKVESNAGAVTIFLSEVSCGQSSSLLKIASLRNDSVILRLNSVNNNSVKKFNEFNSGLAEQFFNLKIVNLSSLSEIVSETRKSIENKKNVFIDLKASLVDMNESKKFIDGLKRAFDSVEVILTLSAINSEIYNKKIVSKYRHTMNAVMFTYLDQCLNFGQLFNISYEYGGLPLTFFSTGEVVPDDIESATSERVVAGIFNLN